MNKNKVTKITTASGDKGSAVLEEEGLQIMGVADVQEGLGGQWISRLRVSPNR
jgi:hypothetical protein